MPSRTARSSRRTAASAAFLFLLLAGSLACSDEGRTEPCLATEDCFNGFDDDCDRLTDCDDPDCAPDAVCVPAAEGFATGATVAADEACPAPFPGDGLLLGEGLQAGSTCAGCACATPDLGCYSQITSYPLTACRPGSTGGARSVGPDFCAVAPFGFAVSDATAEVRHGAACQPSGTPAPPPLAWADTARFCAAARLGAGCGAGLACAPRAASHCVVAAGEAACPAGYAPAGSEPWYAGVEDTRFCSGECACGPVTGWSCGTGMFRIFSAPGCTGTSTLVAPNTCVGTVIQSALLELSGPTAPGSCTPDAGLMEGAATPTGPHTLCCLR